VRPWCAARDLPVIDSDSQPVLTCRFPDDLQANRISSIFGDVSLGIFGWRFAGKGTLFGGAEAVVGDGEKGAAVVERGDRGGVSNDRRGRR
jgi:hypothetical protein